MNRIGVEVSYDSESSWTYCVMGLSSAHTSQVKNGVCCGRGNCVIYIIVFATDHRTEALCVAVTAVKDRGMNGRMGDLVNSIVISSLTED